MMQGERGIAAQIIEVNTKAPRGAYEKLRSLMGLRWGKSESYAAGNGFPGNPYTEHSVYAHLGFGVDGGIVLWYRHIDSPDSNEVQHYGFAIDSKDNVRGLAGIKIVDFGNHTDCERIPPIQFELILSGIEAAIKLHNN